MKWVNRLMILIDLIVGPLGLYKEIYNVRARDSYTCPTPYGEYRLSDSCWFSAWAFYCVLPAAAANLLRNVRFVRIGNHHRPLARSYSLRQVAVRDIIAVTLGCPQDNP